MLQQALSGHWFILEMSESSLGSTLPGFCWPQTALGKFSGNGGLPLLRHMMVSLNRKFLQVFQPHVFLLYSSSSSCEREYSADRLSQVSPSIILCVKQEPSAF